MWVKIKDLDEVESDRDEMVDAKRALLARILFYPTLLYKVLGTRWKLSLNGGMKLTR